MKQFFVFINDETEGPFPQSDIEAKIKAGEYPDDVLIADADKEDSTEDDWVPAKEILQVRRVGMGLKIAGNSVEEAARLREAREDKLDPEIRQKLMRYGLADAISVEKFTPEQAFAAVQIYEQEKKKEKLIKIGAGVGGFLVTFGLFSLIFNIELGGAPNRNLLAPIVELMKAPNEEYAKHARGIAKQVQQLDELREEVANVEFVLPVAKIKDEKVREELMKFVVVPAEMREFTTAKVDFQNLFALLGNLEEIQVLLPRNSISATAKNWITKELEERVLKNSPMWDDAELQKTALQELAPLIPSNKNVSMFAKKFVKMLEELKCETALDAPAMFADELVKIVKTQDGKTQYHYPIERDRIKTRCDAHGELPAELSQQLPRQRDLELLPKDGSGKFAAVDWACRQMPAFLDKFDKFLKTNALSFSAETRQKRWDDFVKKQGDSVKSEITKLENETAYELDENGQFTIRGNKSQLRNACLRFKLNGETMIVPAGLTYNPNGPSDLVAKNPSPATAVSLPDSEIVSRKTTQEDMVGSERYEIVSKTQLGNVAFWREGVLGDRKVPVVKMSPTLCYINVTRVDPTLPEGERPKRAREICFGVPAEDFAAMNEGDKLTIDELAKYPIYARPTDAQNRSQLRQMPKELADEYLAKIAANPKLAYQPRPKADAEAAGTEADGNADADGNAESAGTPEAGDAEPAAESAETENPAPAESAESSDEE